MAYPVMDDCLAAEFRKVVSYSTSIVAGDGGEEDRDPRWTLARRRFMLSPKGRLANDLILKLEMLFHETRGPWLTFLFKDKRDFNHWQVSTDPSAIRIGTGTGSATAFPVVKLYGSGANQRTRTNINPISGTLKIYLAGVLKTEGTDYMIDYETGVITFTAAPGNGVAITAEFQFRTRVRFNSDDLDIEQLSQFGKYLTSSFELYEVRR